VTYGQSADQNFKVMDLSGVGEITPTDSRADVIWGASLFDINTANGVIENATAVGISDALIAEARFFRAFDYFLLVQTFGGGPLDIGSGELKFNSTPSRVSVRNTVPEVYTKAIFPDLLKAVSDLPANNWVQKYCVAAHQEYPCSRVKISRATLLPQRLHCIHPLVT